MWVVFIIKEWKQYNYKKVKTLKSSLMALSVHKLRKIVPFKY